MQYDLSLPIEFRRIDTDFWLSGFTEQIGANCVRFRAVKWIEPSSRIEIIFRMPVSDPCNVVCSGTILGIDFPEKPGTLPLISASIDRYSFVR
jgi:hypothetical protein